MSLGATDLNLLVPLRALLEDVNVTRAGVRVGMSQPAMSSALSRLRRHYHDELLVRVGRDYELTPLARSLLLQLQETMPLVERAFDLREEFDPASSTRVFSVAASDAAVAVLHQPLRERLDVEAPSVTLSFGPLVGADSPSVERVLLGYDFLVGPAGYGSQTTAVPLLRDRFVCVVDGHNPHVQDGRISEKALADLPHAVAEVGSELAVVNRALWSAGIERSIQVQTYSWLSLPFLVRGTDLVAILPERLARRIAGMEQLKVAELPRPDLLLDSVETLSWHPSRTDEPGHVWMRDILRAVAAAA